MSFFLSDLFKDNPELEEKIKKVHPQYEPEIYDHREDDSFNQTLEEVVKDGNYRRFKPGTFQWKAIWEEHPELQEEMLSWSERIFVWCEHRGQRIAFRVCINIQVKNECPTCKLATEGLAEDEKIWRNKKE